MKSNLETGDRVAWSEVGRGIVVAREDQHGGATRMTVAIWQGSEFSGHVTRLSTGLLHRTGRLHPPRASSTIRTDG
jgi:hypothetical protein